jgi:subtilase family serine protease
MLIYLAGKHLTNQQVLDLIAPKEEEVEPVLEWLRASGVTFRWMGDVIKAVGTVDQIEDMFQTNLYVYEHDESGKLVHS